MTMCPNLIENRAVFDGVLLKSCLVQVWFKEKEPLEERLGALKVFINRQDLCTKLSQHHSLHHYVEMYCFSI